ncbi:MAG TPA: gluconokinase [Ktedonobacterales bacterium]|jgi:gluconokinase|nr:gluconokinase [Ktedonobacterales bacterium]
MKQPGCAIGADIGTTTVKAVAFDTSGHEIARAEETLKLTHADDGAAEQDPVEVFAAVSQTIGQAGRQAQARGYAVERIGLSAAMHSLLPVDSADRPLMNAMTWMDTRAKEDARALWDSAEGRDLYARTGAPIHPMAPLPKLLWLRRVRPRVFESAARFVSLKEWVWWQWFGEWSVDASIASATGLYNLREGAWDRGALELAHISADRLSTIVPTTTTKTGANGPWSAQAGINADAAFTIGASDGVLANLGVGAIGDDQMVLTIGTSCAVRSGSAKPFTDLATRSFCYVLDRDRFIVGGPSNSGGIVIDWLYHNILNERPTRNPIDPMDEQSFLALMERAKGARPDADLICLPYVAGERAPLWDASASAACLGLHLEHTAADVMRAAVEGIIMNAYWIASGLFESLGKPQRIISSGKVLEPEWIRRLTADVFGIPVQYRGAVDASVVGAVTLAEIATGVRSWEQVARPLTEDVSTIAPSGDDFYQRKYKRFRAIAELALNRG